MEWQWERYHIFLACLMVITGSIYTLVVKFSHGIKSKGADGEMKHFYHPFFQVLIVFVGECLCFVTFKILYFAYRAKQKGLEDRMDLTKGNRDFNHLVLFVPAMCHMVSNCANHLGLILTYASSYQMFRASSIIFVSLLSEIFLERRLGLQQWGGIALILFGLVFVAFADSITHRSSTDRYKTFDVIIGDVMIISAQALVAIRLVLEEKYVVKLDIPPLQAAGWEGIFGLTITALLLVAFYFVNADPPITMHKGDRLEDSIDALVQLSNSWKVMLITVVIITAIGLFYFSGVSITKELSAVTRNVIDSSRTIIIWIFSMALFGQKFHWLQLIGFVLMSIGICVYSQITVASFRGSQSYNTEEFDVLSAYSLTLSLTDL